MKYYTDGYVRARNPSPYGGGYTIVNEAGALVETKYIERAGFTNNDGEILGILNAMRMCNDKDIVSTDSMCALTWANSGRSKARPDLNELLQECRDLLVTKRINLCWEGREHNLAGIWNENTSRKHEYNATNI